MPNSRQNRTKFLILHVEKYAGLTKVPHSDCDGCDYENKLWKIIDKIPKKRFKKMIMVELGRSLRRLRRWLVIILCEQTAAIVHHNCTRVPSLKRYHH